MLLKGLHQSVKSPMWAFLVSAALSTALLLTTGCSGDKTSDADVVAQVGESVLTNDELVRAVPGGLSPEDSTSFVRSYVTDWVERHLISDYASDGIDMDEINHLTDDYRRNLITIAYRRKVFESMAESVADDSIKAYYDAHRQDFVLERPLVKGVYLKVRDDAKNLSTLRRLYRSARPEDIDRLEKEILESTIHYDYFRDKWIDWEQIETRIPYQFGDDDTWLKSNYTLDYTAGGYTYLLAISEFLPSGSPMPIETARAEIINRLLNSRRREFDRELTRRLYNEALKAGKLRVNISLE